MEAASAGVMNDLLGSWKLSENKPRDTFTFVNYILRENPAQRNAPPETGPYIAMTGGRIPETKQELRFWRSKDFKADDQTFEQVRKEVVAAWKLDKARALARKEAEKFEAEVNKLKATPADAERYLKEQKLTPFELEKVAQVTAPALEPLSGLPTEYRRYEVPEDKFELFPYPPRDFPKPLMKLTRLGDATVVVDMPAKTFYVSVLVDRKEPDLVEFKSVYVRSPGSDPMYMALQGQRRDEYRKSVMEQLRRDAGADLDKDGRYKLPESVRKDPSQFEGE